MKLHMGIVTAAIAAAALFSAAPAFAEFNYTVNYSDTFGNANYPATTKITTNSANSYFTLSPGGSATGSTTPTAIGLFALAPVSTDTSGIFTINSTAFTAVVNLQTVTNIDGSGPIGSPAPFTITGTVSGTFGPDGDNTDITGISGLPVRVTAGGIIYNIALDSVRNPGVVGGLGNSGGVTLDVTRVPEPASLSMLGLGAVALFARRRK